MKRFEGLVQHAIDAGLKVVIGNGVQTDYNCLLESMSFVRCGLHEAAENIGFSKLNGRVTKNSISIEQGRLSADFPELELDIDFISRHTVKRVELAN